MSSNPQQSSSADPRGAFQASGSSATAPALGATARKKRGNRGGRKKKSRKQSFAPGVDDTGSMAPSPGDGALPTLEETPRSSFYITAPPRRLSETSLESEALLDHRYVCIPPYEGYILTLFRKEPATDATTP